MKLTDKPLLDRVALPIESTHETGHSVILNKLDAVLEKLDKTNFFLEKIAHSSDKWKWKFWF